MNALKTALLWHSIGVSCIPILAGSKLPALEWKPYQERLPTRRELRSWFATGYNLAVLTGGARNLVVLDWDDLWAYSIWIAGLDGNVLYVLATYRVRARRGWHYYFWNDGESVRTQRMGQVDVKAAGGYVLAPPSIHPSGVPYIGYGDPRRISHTGSLRELLKDQYVEMPERQFVSRHALSDDPFVDAMRPQVELNGISIDDILTRVDLVALAERAGAQLRQCNGEWRGACPLHGGDNETAFVIYDDGGHMRWRCFTNCREPSGGDVLDFYSTWKDVSIREAMAELANSNY